jgi:hypothetical protein
MTNNRLLVLLLLACCLAQPVFGQIAFGGRDCGQWIKRTDSEMRKVTDEAWLGGYMSGLNRMYSAANSKISGLPDPLNKVNSGEQIVLWMDNYCLKNPLNRVSTGAFVLFLELMEK